MPCSVFSRASAHDAAATKVVIAGGTGQVGTTLARAFHAMGREVVVLSRSRRTAPWRSVVWDAQTLGPWTSELESAAAVINLAGRSVDCRYGPENRRTILASRVDSTGVIGAAIASATKPPRAWLQAGTATIYAHRYDAPNDEATGILGETSRTPRAPGVSASPWRERGSAHSETRSFQARGK